ncbi:efflux RND transporter periplasmic adaptor subunit [Pendulispora rubella]|uniref:Efflux RND transporter periplasmic adaptor subunit n=1 Tax=Pendulispora rubella TaxID=2741070 RepID=A0ABZ2L5I2_9BACT
MRNKPGRIVGILVSIVGLLAVVGILAGIKAGQIGQLINMGKEGAKAGPPPESVSSGKVDEQTWEGTLQATGSVTSLKGVSLSNDAAGIVTRINFESGKSVKAGQVLVELDTSVERGQLAQARARQELALSVANRTRALVSSGSIAQAQLDTDEAGLKGSNTEIETLEAQIQRKIVKAPFSGRLGIRLVNLGQYLSPGTALTVLEAIEQVYVDFTLPQQRLPDVSVGMPVRLSATASPSADADAGAGGSSWEGTIAAVDPSVDSNTRQIKLRASLNNKELKLRPGMYVNVTVVLPNKGKVVSVPSTSVVHASYGESVFVIEDKKPDSPGASKSPTGQPIKIARQQFVRKGEARGDYVAILDGVKPGQEVVTAGAFKLRNGAPIVVNNDVQAKPQLDPHPENH